MYERVRTVVKLGQNSRKNFSEKEQYPMFSLKIKIDRKNFCVKEYRETF